MARIRTVKPEFWTDGHMVRLSAFARLLYIGSWNFALCDNGHLPDDAMSLKLKVLPADPVDADELLEEIISTGRIVRKATGDGRSYLHIVRLVEHQKTDARWQSRCPYCLAEAHDTANGSPRPPQGSANHGEPPEDSAGNADTPGNSANLAETRASHDEPHPNSPQESKGKESKGSTTNSSSPASPPRDIEADAEPPDEDNPGQIPGMPRAPAAEKPPKPGSDDDPDWVKFWTIWPKKVGKPDARKAWAKAVTKVAPFVIIAAAERYRDLVVRREKRDKRHIKDPSGWLNGERWTDEIPGELASTSTDGRGGQGGARAQVNDVDWSKGFNMGGNRR